MHGADKLRRILALDLGARRIGLAVSDELGITAQGLPSLTRQKRGQDLERLAELARTYHVQLWLLGLPRHLSGDEGAQAARARDWGARLHRHTSIPVAFWDERLTTVEANRVLRSAHTSREATRRAVDRLSAVILLQSYLDARSLAEPSV